MSSSPPAAAPTLAKEIRLRDLSAVIRRMQAGGIIGAHVILPVPRNSKEAEEPTRLMLVMLSGGRQAVVEESLVSKPHPPACGRQGFQR